MKQIIHIYGASGAGTSTLGRKISERLGYTFMDTDDYFWMPTNPPFTTKREKSERISLMRKDIEAAKNVVLSGSLTGWGDELIPLFTLAVRLETDTKLRIERLRKRESERFGARIEAGGDMYKNHQDYLEWASKYDTGNTDMRSKAMHDHWEQQLPCRKLLLNGADDLEVNLRKVEESIKQKD